jgi:hypothetical protein
MNMVDLKDLRGYPMRVKDSVKYLEFLRSLDRTALRRGDRAVLQNRIKETK